MEMGKAKRKGLACDHKIVINMPLKHLWKMSKSQCDDNDA